MHLPFDEHGILLRRDAIASGIEDDWLHRMVRTDELSDRATARVNTRSDRTGANLRGINPDPPM